MGKKLGKWSLWVGVAAFFALPLTSWAQLTVEDLHKTLDTTQAHVGNLTGHAKDGAAAYRRYCVGCHGELGDGNGENAEWMEPPLFPKPRNFQLGVFKCRSTPSGTLPLDSDLYDSIGRGFDRSMMPPWNTLTNQEKVDLVAWVKHFSPRWAGEKPGDAIKIPDEPAVTPERIKAGREVFAKVQCWKCHGVTGQANGPSASTLTDDLGRPIAPFNFTEGARPKCGSTDRDIYRIFMTGLDGTPMPSYADIIKPDEGWNLVFYLRTLMSQKSVEKEMAKKLDLKPVDPNAPPPAAQ
jgi:cytochrome c oxidase cbb3-type subunit 2